jgi:hypothetical protein
MENVFLYAGNTYYFVVDGYNEDCGEYVLQIYISAPNTIMFSAIAEFPVLSCQPCGLEYVIEIDGYTGPSPVEHASWTTIKALYR